MLQLNKLMQAQLDKMCASGSRLLFRSNLTGDQLWDIYLRSFNKEDDPVFRDPTSSLHNCNTCKHFIRRYGNIVSIDENYNITTMFDFEIEGEYSNSVRLLSKSLKESKIESVFAETFENLKNLPYESCKTSNTRFQLGIKSNPKRYTFEEAVKFGVVKQDETYIFNHLYVFIPKEYISTSLKSIEALIGTARDTKNLFQRAMEEIPLETLTLVRDLINQDSLLDGKTHIHKVNALIPLKSEYDCLLDDKKDNWCWVYSHNNPFARFKNELIGTLCSDIAEGNNLTKCCELWNKRVDPVNYMKTTAPITKKQIEEARSFVEENGYTESFNRRCATLEDVKVSEILHINSDNTIKKISVFDNIKSSDIKKGNDFKNIEEITINTFMSDILPQCTSVELYFQNKHKNNLVTMTTSESNSGKNMFKWNNNYSWSYVGNLAGKSQITEAVKNAGGKIDGVLRFSISWNEDGRSICDFDAHAIIPCKYYSNNKEEIFYGHSKSRYSGGELDIDMIRPPKRGVENITWSDLKLMPDGVYRFFIRNFDHRNNTGVKAEIVFGDSLYSYEVQGNVQNDVYIADVILKEGNFIIQHRTQPINDGNNSINLWNIDTNNFHKVNLVCLSPNHWGDSSIGNKHYFFMIENCKTADKIRGFHNENLNSELTLHRKVMEVLGASVMIDPIDNQLSGLGFNATVRDSVILRLKGSFNRMVKVLF